MIKVLTFGLLLLYPIISSGQAKDTTLALDYKKRALQFANDLQHDSAIVYYHKAAEIYQVNKQWNRHYLAVLKQGHQLKRQNKYKQAQKLAARSIAAIYRKKIDQQQELIGKYWGLVGELEQWQGHHKKAVDACLKAEEILIKAKKRIPALRIKVFRANVLLDLAYHNQSLVMLKQVEKALEKYPLSKKIKHIMIDLYLFRSVIQISYLRAYDQVLEVCHKGITLIETMKPTKLALYEKAQFYYNQGTIYKNQGKLLKAKNSYRHYIHLMEITKGKKHVRTALGILQLGRVYVKERKLDSALYFIQKSLNLHLLKHKANAPELAYIYNNLGYVYTLKKNYKRANQDYTKALTSLKKVYGTIHPNLVLLYVYMASNYGYMGQYRKSLEITHKALMSNTRTFRDTSMYAIPPFKDYYNINFFLGGIIGKGNALTQVSSSVKGLKIALQHYKIADRYIKQLRKGVKDKNDRLLVGRLLNNIPVYGIRTCELLYQKTGDQKYLEDAFYFAERGKASLLISSLAEAKAKRFGDIPVNLLKEELALRKKHAFYQTQLSLNKGATYQDSLYQIGHVYEALIKKFEQHYPKYAQLKFEHKRVTLRDIQQTLSPKTALLEYTFCRYNIYLLLITRNQVKLIRIPDVEKVKQLLSNYYNQLDAQARLKKFAQASHQLYRAILQPAQPYLTGIKKLVIVAPATENIPFEALVTQSTRGKKLGDNFSRPHYLVKSYQMSYHYSATLWQQQVQKVTPSSPQLAAFAPFSTGEAKVYNTRNPQGKLPESGVEVKAIYNLFKQKGFTAEAYLSKNATKSIFLQKAKQASFVHIASHSRANTDNTRLACISFAADNDQRKDLPKNLLSSEIYNLELNAELLVLSSCESGVGKFVKGEGVLSLVRSFLYAGAKNILFSLWEVDDLYTRQLMVAFYKNLLNQSQFDYQQSLQTAQLTMIQQGVHPKHWAGIIMIGR